MARHDPLSRLASQVMTVRFGVGTKIIAVPLLVCGVFGVLLWFISGSLSRIQSQSSLFELLAELGGLSERTALIAEAPQEAPPQELAELAREWSSKSDELQKEAQRAGFSLSNISPLDVGVGTATPQVDDFVAALLGILDQAHSVATRATELSGANSRRAAAFRSAALEAQQLVAQARKLSREQIDQATGRANSLVLTALILTVFLALGAGIWVSKGISARIMELSTVAEQLASGKLSRRATVHTKDELGLLAITLNEMARRLERAQAQLKASSVSRQLVGEILKDLGDQMRESTLAMYNTGGRLAEKLGGSLGERLKAFQLQGLGELRLAESQEASGELRFAGTGLFQAMTPAGRQADDFARGFLSRTAELLTGAPCNCEEMACQAVGDEECTFIVYPLEAQHADALDALVARLPRHEAGGERES